MRKIKILSVFNFLAVLIHISAAYATQFRLINSKNVGEVSDFYNSLFTPAAITFTIWGIIYIGLLIYSFYHIIVAFRYSAIEQSNKEISKTGLWFIFNNLGAACWLLAWTNQQIGISVLLIFCQLMALLIIHLRTGIYNPERTAANLLFSQVPLSIYFAWITIASIANVSAYLVSVGWDGWGISAVVWTGIMITAAVLLSVIIMVTRRNAIYGLVVVWALYGIALKRQEADPVMYASIIKIAWVGIGIVALTALLQVIKNTRISHTGHIDNRFPVANHSLK